MFGALTACSDPAPPAVAPAPSSPAAAQEPAAAVREPAAAVREPAAAVREPAAAVREPAAGNSATPGGAATPVRGNEPQAETPTRTTARQKAEAGLDRFVMLVRERLPQVVIDRRDEEIATLGELTCAELARGRKAAAIVADMRAQGLTGPDARTLLALARNSACPT